MSGKKATCLICNKTFEGDFHYCPNCGAKMPSSKDDEERAIDAAINELFIDENTEKKKDDLKILPIHESAKEVVKEVQSVKKAIGPSKVFNLVGIGLALIVIGLLIFFAMKIFTPSTPVSPNKPNTPEVNQPSDPQTPNTKPDINEEVDDLKVGIDLVFDVQLQDMEGSVSVDKINFKIKDENAITLTYYYTASDALTITFADSEQSFNPIGIDVPSGSSSVYFDLSKSLLSAERDFIVTMRKSGDEDSKAAIITIDKKTIEEIIAKLN